MSGAVFRMWRARSRSDHSSIKAATASSRWLISSTSAEGDTRRLINSRAPGGRDGAVDGGEDGRRTLVPGPHQLQARSRGRVDGQKRSHGLALRRLERGPFAHLRKVHIMKESADHREIAILEVAQPVERRNLEGLLQGAFAPRLREVRPRQRGQRRTRRFARRLWRFVRDFIVRDQKFGGAYAQKLARKIGRSHIAQEELARRDIERGDVVAHRCALPASRDCRKEVVAAGDEKRVLGERARRDKAHHIATHHRLRPALLGKLRVFKLLRHRHAKALADELLQIIVGARDGHAAHGDVFARMLAALCELDAERVRGLHRVVEEQLEEIAHAVEKQKLRMLRLYLEVLRHHGGGVLGFARVLARLGLLHDRRQIHPPPDSHRQAEKFTRAVIPGRRARAELSPLASPISALEVFID